LPHQPDASGPVTAGAPLIVRDGTTIRGAIDPRLLV
jgi:hypothetical protein